MKKDHIDLDFDGCMARNGYAYTLGPEKDARPVLFYTEDMFVRKRKYYGIELLERKSDGADFYIMNERMIFRILCFKYHRTDIRKLKNDNVKPFFDEYGNPYQLIFMELTSDSFYIIYETHIKPIERINMLPPWEAVEKNDVKGWKTAADFPPPIRFYGKVATPPLELKRKSTKPPVKLQPFGAPIRVRGVGSNQNNFQVLMQNISKHPQMQNFQMQIPLDQESIAQLIAQQKTQQQKQQLAEEQQRKEQEAEAQRRKEAREQKQAEKQKLSDYLAKKRARKRRQKRKTIQNPKVIMYNGKEVIDDLDDL